MRKYCLTALFCYELRAFAAKISGAIN